MTLAKLRERHAGHVAISLQAWPGRRLAPSTELQAGGRCLLTASGGLRPTDVLLPQWLDQMSPRAASAGTDYTGSMSLSARLNS